MSDPSKPETLGYSFVPVPAWIFADLATGAITDSDFVLISFVYQHAKTGKLMARAETPRLSVDEIAKATRSKDDTVSKRLRRLRGRYFDERVEGTKATGYFRVFRLFPDAPEPSEHGPTEKPPSGPTETADENGSGGGIVTARGDDPSDHAERADSAFGPTEPPSGPTKKVSANPHGEPDRAPSEVEPVRPSLDVLEKTNLCSKGRTALERLDQDHSLVGEETSRASESEPPLWETYDPVEAKRLAHERNRAREQGAG